MSETKSLAELKKELPEQLNEAQLAFIQGRTPSVFIRERAGRGGGKFKYVEVGYVDAQLNAIFGFGGWDWEYEIIQPLSFPHTEEIVLNGTLTVRVKNNSTGETATIKKQASGGGKIKYIQNTKEPIDLADEVKSASADARKKAASLLGIAADVYNPRVFETIEQLRAANRVAQSKQVINHAEVTPAIEAEVTNIIEDEDDNDDPSFTDRSRRLNLYKKIFAAANELNKGSQEWQESDDTRRKELLKNALSKQVGFTVASFTELSIEQLEDISSILNDAVRAINI